MEQGTGKKEQGTQCALVRNTLSFHTLTRLRILFFLILFACCSPVLRAQCGDENFSFGDGEVVTYNAYYNWHFIWINAGILNFSVAADTFQNRPAWFLSAYGCTFSGYDPFMKVRDTFEVYMDKELYKPLYFNRVTKEGSTEAHYKYSYDYDANKIFASIKRGKEGSFTDSVVTLKDCTNDLLSMIYKARNIDFTSYDEGAKIPIRMIVDGKIHDLYIRYLGKEIIETREDRKFRCLKFRPLLVPGTIFKSGEDMTVWVTDDLNRIPIIVEAKVLVGSVKAVFLDAKGLRNPVAAEITDE